MREKAKRFTLRLSERAKKALDALRETPQGRLPYSAVIRLLLYGYHPAEIDQKPKGIFGLCLALSPWCREAAARETISVDLFPDEHKTIERLRQVIYLNDSFKDARTARVLTRCKAVERLILAAFENKEEFRKINAALSTIGAAIPRGR